MKISNIAIGALLLLCGILLLTSCGAAKGKKVASTPTKETEIVQAAKDDQVGKAAQPAPEESTTEPEEEQEAMAVPKAEKVYIEKDGTFWNDNVIQKDGVWYGWNTEPAVLKDLLTTSPDYTDIVAFDKTLLTDDKLLVEISNPSEKVKPWEECSISGYMITSEGMGYSFGGLWLGNRYGYFTKEFGEPYYQEELPDRTGMMYFWEITSDKGSVLSISATFDDKENATSIGVYNPTKYKE